MSERDDLAIRAEVLSKLADQLSEQLAVERKANDELRTILRDGPTLSVHREEPVRVAPVATTLAAVAVGMSICAAVAASWLGPPGGATCGRSTIPIATTVAALPPIAVLPSPAPPPVRLTPLPAPAPDDPGALALAGPNPRDCGRITNVTAARCFVAATGDSASGEYLLRNLILAHTLLGERGRAQLLAARYFADFGPSPFARQIRQLGYAP